MDTLAREPSSAADMRQLVQVIFGFNGNKWNDKFPQHAGTLNEFNVWGSPMLDKIIKLGWTFGVVQYGLDVWLGPIAGSGGTLDFTQCDKKVPEMLMLLPPDAIAILPVSGYNWGRLDAIIEYFSREGWLDNRQWAVFYTDVADEPRQRHIVYQSNLKYLEFKSMYPDILWITTDTRLPAILSGSPEGNGVLLGDIIIPYMYHDMFELYRYTKDDSWCARFWEWAHAWGETGFYLSGSFDDDTNPFGCGYYKKVMIEQFDEASPPIIPTPSSSPEKIKAWVRDQSGKYFLHWDMTDWFDADDSGNPVAKLALRKLILEV